MGIKNLLFDFDGVIIDSIPIRTFGLRELFKNFENVKVEKLIEYHLKNGGATRYQKITYFYNQILNKSIDQKEVMRLGAKFSEIVKKLLINRDLLIEQTMNFIKKNKSNFNIHIVSASEDMELKYICKKLDISKFFNSIHGSPEIKENLIKNIFYEYKYVKDETILIGDAINDLKAANKNDIKFYGFNNITLRKNSYYYIENFDSLVF